MKRILIANRGEIAVRLIRACRELEISPVLVVSEADVDSVATSLVDAYEVIGPGPASESYLQQDRILAAAESMGADAIHPGYGFLSENASFSAACRDHGITFIGPAPESIRLLGDKIAAKQRMREAGVPVVPGYEGADQSDEHLLAEAETIGVPLLIKAAAGGGGRGMRVVRSLSEFDGQLEEARREALAAFGDSRVLLERYVERSRHIEFQIFGDQHGNVVHLFERECSIQRRHQKIVEESPSVVLTAELRDRMGEAAVKAGLAANYSNAGTVEFLFEERPDGDHQYYFLEVNTRLQVEHPVTELVTGVDLAQLQIRVARGESLPFNQADLKQTGSALEVRLYAEDPSTGFLPSVGKIVEWIAPEGPGIRVDSGVRKGSEVSPFYDPMLAKLIVLGRTRAEAIQRMGSALRSTHVLGVTTNVEFLLEIVSHSSYATGHLSTRFLAENFADWKAPEEIPEEVLLALAAYDNHLGNSNRKPRPQSRDTIASPWLPDGAWRNVRRTP